MAPNDPHDDDGFLGESGDSFHEFADRSGTPPDEEFLKSRGVEVYSADEILVILSDRTDEGEDRNTED